MKVIYTYTDEAPALATHSLLPIIRGVRRPAGVEVELRDISLAGPHPRPVPGPPDDEQRVPDALAELGELAKTPDANIIKLPNISASIPQLRRRSRSCRTRATTSRTTTDDARRLRPRQGQRGQPGAARGQLRPPRARLGEGVRAQAPALDGRVVARTRRRTSRR